MSNLWFVYSLGASVMWGMGYVITEKVLKSGISPTTSLLFHAAMVLPLYLLIGVHYGNAAAELKMLWENKTLLLLAIASSAMVVLGNLGILTGMVSKNAALVSMIEVSYPLFVILFSYLFLADFTISVASIAGGLLIMAGVLVVCYFNT